MTLCSSGAGVRSTLLQSRGILSREDWTEGRKNLFMRRNSPQKRFMMKLLRCSLSEERFNTWTRLFIYQLSLKAVEQKRHVNADVNIKLSIFNTLNFPHYQETKLLGVLVRLWLGKISMVLWFLVRFNKPVCISALKCMSNHRYINK